MTTLPPPDDLLGQAPDGGSEAVLDEVVAGLFAIALDINLALPYLSGAVAQRLSQARHDTERLIRLLREDLALATAEAAGPLGEAVPGLDDPRSLTSLARHEVRVAERDGTPLKLVYLELARPEVDDRPREEVTAGELATVLRQGCRATDVVARWSPDAFVVLMRNSTAQEASDVAHRLRETFAGRRPDGVPRVLSVAVVQRRTGEGLEDLVARAREHLDELPD